MPDNYYSMLGVDPRAAVAEIRAAHQAALQKLAADTRGGEAERATLKRELDIAVRTLTSRSTRDAYDASLDEGRAGGSSWTAYLGSPLLWTGLLLIVTIAGTAGWLQQREEKRLRVQRELAVAEQEQQRRMVEAKQAVERERQRVLDEIRLQREAEETQRQAANEVRNSENDKKQFVAGERPNPLEQRLNVYVDRADSWRRQAEERQVRQDEERSLSQARAEVERQRRALEQREREDQYARARRESNARYGN
jgi:hypothetical protein